jgi:hypothetical protein
MGDLMKTAVGTNSAIGIANLTDVIEGGQNPA